MRPKHSIPFLILWFAIFQTDAFPQAKVFGATSLESEIFALTNKERAKHGLKPLRFNKLLRELSRIQSYNMMEHTFFSHVDHKGRTPGDRKQEYFPQLLGGVGENIAYVRGIPVKKMARKFMKMWMDSPGHRENILRKEFGHLGIGIIEEKGIYYATQTFGELIALHLDDVEKSYPYDSEKMFRFQFLGKFPKQVISIAAKFPDAKARFYTSENSFYTGVGIYKPEWNGETFAVRIKFDKGRGDYELQMGSFGAYHEGGLVFQVE